ncbi:hypothetical protein X798_01477, partial [Onchocerca flexuosa]
MLKFNGTEGEVPHCILSNIRLVSIDRMSLFSLSVFSVPVFSCIFVRNSCEYRHRYHDTSLSTTFSITHCHPHSISTHINAAVPLVEMQKTLIARLSPALMYVHPKCICTTALHSATSCGYYVYDVARH